MPIFWKAVCYLEKINLKVIAATADGASPNRLFFKIQKLLDGNAETDVVYQTKKNYPHTRESIFFFQTLHI